MHAVNSVFEKLLETVSEDPDPGQKQGQLDFGSTYVSADVSPAILRLFPLSLQTPSQTLKRRSEGVGNVRGSGGVFIVGTC